MSYEMNIAKIDLGRLLDLLYELLTWNTHIVLCTLRSL